jgi:hypothetical protein
LQQETGTLAGVDGKPGTQTQVLVPHVYAAFKAGDLSPKGDLLSGDSVAIQTTEDFTNTGRGECHKRSFIAYNNSAKSLE